MTRSIKAQELSIRLDRLDAIVGSTSATASVKPVARKTNDGSDRYGGFPPA